MGKRKHKMTFLQARKIIKTQMIEYGLRVCCYSSKDITVAAKKLQAAENASDPPSEVSPCEH